MEKKISLLYVGKIKDFKKIINNLSNREWEERKCLSVRKNTKRK